MKSLFFFHYGLFFLSLLICSPTNKDQREHSIANMKSDEKPISVWKQVDSYQAKQPPRTLATKIENEAKAVREEKKPSGCLIGTYWVQCNQGHNDQVDGITCNHHCSQCKFDNLSVDDGKAMVVCPKGHATRVEDHTLSHKCTFAYPNGTICNLECRLD